VSRFERSASRKERRCEKCPGTRALAWGISLRSSEAKRKPRASCSRYCAALDLPLSVVLNVVSEKMAVYEGVTALPSVRAMAQAAA
jgi:hypothetical protein